MSGPLTRVTQADPAACRAAARYLANGGLVAFPTETAYELGADATNEDAIARLDAAAGRARFQLRVTYVRDLASAQRLARFDGAAERLARAFWPGPLRLVLPRTSAPSGGLTAGDPDTIVLQVSGHRIVQGILAAFRQPIVTTAANRSDRPAPTSATQVLAGLRGRIDLIVNAGSVPGGSEPTVVACIGTPTVLQPGSIAQDAIAAVVARASG